MEPKQEGPKRAKDAHCENVATSNGGKRRQHHQPGGHICLLGREGGQCPGQQEMQENLEKKHGRFFKERWEEYSSSQCKAGEEKSEGKEAWGEVGSTEAEGPRDKTTKFLREKKNHEKLGSSLSITLGMICLNALVSDLKTWSRTTGRPRASLTRTPGAAWGWDTGTTSSRASG